MNNKKFMAILAKNNIVKEIVNAPKNSNGLMGEIVVSSGRLLHELREIEAYIGSANQPDINEILSL